MKTKILLMIFSSISLPCSAAFMFTGGNGEDLRVTLTEDLAIPFNAPSDGNSLGLVFVLENVYSVPQPQQGFFPNTRYGSPGSITSILQYQNGASLLGTDYAIWGTPGFGLGIIDTTDFIGSIQFQYDHLPNAQAGDILLIKAGTIVIPDFLGIVRPDLPVTTIQVSNGSTGHAFSAAWAVDMVVVPEPGSVVLICLACGLLVVFRKRRCGKEKHGVGMTLPPNHACAASNPAIALGKQRA